MTKLVPLSPSPFSSLQSKAHLAPTPALTGMRCPRTANCPGHQIPTLPSGTDSAACWDGREGFAQDSALADRVTELSSKPNGDQRGFTATEQSDGVGGGKSLRGHTEGGDIFAKLIEQNSCWRQVKAFGYQGQGCYLARFLLNLALCRRTQKGNPGAWSRRPSEKAHWGSVKEAVSVRTHFTAALKLFASN